VVNLANLWIWYHLWLFRRCDYVATVSS